MRSSGQRACFSRPLVEMIAFIDKMRDRLGSDRPADADWSCPGFPERVVERMWLLPRGEVVVCPDRIRPSFVSAPSSW